MSSANSNINFSAREGGITLGRRLSTAVVLFHAAIAEHLGLNATDFKSLDLLSQRGALTAGELAELTGLSTGATTELIDRLERAGFARRERDTNDRRRVIIQLVAERSGEIDPYFLSLSQKMYALIEHYNEAELAAILDFVNQMILILEEETQHLRAATKAGKSPRE